MANLYTFPFLLGGHPGLSPVGYDQHLYSSPWNTGKERKIGTDIQLTFQND